ncbi:MMPL family transporter [Marmoricola sp. URHB0036]|uniref:MMPL family transporter n=1 Tax=Marmoricola sp. URHB0036 TaxID=1298863 RepID=UPI00041ACA48|nr:MMPL family transporter [Marmoricola sp. URHB0036]
MHRQIAGKLTGRVTKWFVLAFWIIALMGLGSFAGKLTEVQNNEASSWLPGNAESTQALEKMKPFQDPNAIPTTVVYEKKTGFTPTDLVTMKDQAAQLQDMKYVDGKVIGPIPSEDGRAAQTVVTFNVGSDGWNKMPDIGDDIHKIAKIDGGTVLLAGSGGQAIDSAEAFAGLDSTLLLAALLVVIVLLLFTYRSPILWILPIFSVVVALASSLGLIYFLAKYADLTVNGQSQAIVSILVIGAGTDYALLLVARYREELRRHDDRHEAMAFALHRATPAIIASASTVIVGMLCLTLADMNSTAGLGPVCAIGIAVTLLSMITLLPALLVIFGRWMFWPKRPAFGSDEPTSHGIWARVGAFIRPRPRQVWIMTTLALGVCVLGVLTLNTNGLSTEDSYTKQFDSVKGQNVLTAHGLADNSTPVMVVANADKADDVASAMTGIKNLEDPSKPVVKDGVAFITANLTVDSTTNAAFDTVDTVRSKVHAVDGADALVSGTSAILDDMLKANTRDSKVIIPVTLIVVLLILMLLLRALTAPLILIGTVVLSFGTAIGLGALAFKYVFDYPAVDPSYPLFVFVFLVSLGIDYNIFLMTRVREETAVRGTREGSLVGLAATGGVITSAGLVLAATFGILASLPLVFLVELGFTVALGVLIDTIIIRSVLVTAINLDLGSKIWWPSKLDRGENHISETELPPTHREGVPV